MDPAPVVDRVPALLEGGPRDGEQVLTFDYVRTIETAYEPDADECDRWMCAGWYRPDPDRPGVWTWRGHAPHGDVTPAPPRRRTLGERLADAWAAARGAWSR